MIVYGFLSYENGEVRIPNKELINFMILLYSNAATQKSINSAKSDLKKRINKLRRK